MIFSDGSLTLFRVGFFGAAHGWGAIKPKICHTYPTMMKLGIVIKKIQKYMNQMVHPLSSADISIFRRKSENFAISRNTDIDCILTHNL